VHHFFDPSIEPIVTTDIDNNILYVRTYGLSQYGYPDIIMDQNTDYYEDIFYFIIDRIFSLDFDISSTWSIKGKLFKLMLNQEGLAKIIFPEVQDVNILTILNPINGEPYKYLSFGITELYDLPEVEISADTVYGKEILAFLIEEVKEGWIIDEESIIIFEESQYLIQFINDRLGKRLLKISLSVRNERVTSINKFRNYIRMGDIKRIK